ncbi:MAG: hypothetical protein AAB377_01030 [Patescibacteria group bacterium]
MGGLARLVAITGFAGEKNGSFEVRGSKSFANEIMKLGVASKNIVSFPLSKNSRLAPMPKQLGSLSLRNPRDGNPSS